MEKSGGKAGALNEAAQGGTAEVVSEKRSLTTQERFTLLFDAGSAVDRQPQVLAEADASSTGMAARGRIHGLDVCVVSQDAQACDQGMDAAHWQQVQYAIGIAAEKQLPLIAVFDGASTQWAGGLEAWSAMARSACGAARNPALKLALVTGGNTGFNALLAGLFDAVVMTRSSTALTLTDAPITNRITHTCLQEDELGGWQVHAKRTGLADLVCDNEVMACRAIRRLLQHGAPSGLTWPAQAALAYRPGLDTLIPGDVAQDYDVRQLLREVSDTRSFLELCPDFATNMVVGLASVGGRAVGLLATQNLELAGALDIQACRKAIRHIRLCGAMGIPIVTFVDVPGFVPGQEQEAGGLAMAAADLTRAYALASIPKITIVVGKAFGAAGLVLGSRAAAPHKLAAWRGASLGLMGPEGVRVVAGRSGLDMNDCLATLDVDHALEGGAVDAVFEPGETRQWLGLTLASLCCASGRGT